MATHNAKVIGDRAVAGVAPGGTVALDDEQVNVAALVDGGHVELIPEPKRKTKKGDD